ncbi:MAG: hypothetical protein VKJ44_08225, partial [Synechococcus sp.]|nr:hypothetical protein [Synechococcus sp.]
STESLALYAYLQAMRFLDFGYSATVVVASFLLLALLTLLGWLLLRWGPGRAQDREQDREQGRPVSPATAGGAR